MGVNIRIYSETGQKWHNIAVIFWKGIWPVADCTTALNLPHYELPMEKKVPWNGAVSMRSRAGSWETLSICIALRHNQGAPADMHSNALGILIISRFPLA